MTTLPVVPLQTPPGSRSIVLMVFAHMENRRNLRSIITCHDHQRIVLKAQLTKGLRQLAYNVIELENEVPVRA